MVTPIFQISSLLVDGKFLRTSLRNALYFNSNKIIWFLTGSWIAKSIPSLLMESLKAGKKQLPLVKNDCTVFMRDIMIV